MKMGRIALAAVLVATAATVGCNKKEAAPTESTVAPQPTAPLTPKPVAPSVHIYDTQADAKAEVAAAIKQARLEHKRVILDFGGNWCGDCIVLDRTFHSPENQALLAKDYILVHVNIGKFDANVDIADKYGVPIKKGVPALAVLDGHGKVIYAQKNGEFESMRRMDPASVGQFLEQWKPTGQKA